jgi:hypothetical protein
MNIDDQGNMHYRNSENPEWDKEHGDYNERQGLVATNGANLNHGNRCEACNYASLMSRNHHFRTGTSEK